MLECWSLCSTTWPAAVPSSPSLGFALLNSLGRIIVPDDTLSLVECAEAAEQPLCGYRLYAEHLIERTWST